MSGIGGFLRGIIGGRGAAQKDVPPPTGDLLLRAYGKLPFYAEYRRLEITPGAPIAYSQWMDAGRLAWLRSPTKTEHGQTRPSRIIVRLPDVKEIIVANVWDSRDSGGRNFPISFFVSCLPEALGADPIEQWVAARTLHQAFERAYGELSTFGAGGDFYRLYSKRHIAPRPDDLAAQTASIRQEAAALPASDWFQAWSPDGKLDSGAWFAAVEKHATEWYSQSDAADSLAISVPLASDYSYPAQVVCWLALLQGLVARSGQPLTFIGPGGEKPQGAALHFILRGAKADDFQLLSSDAARYGFVDNLATVPASVVQTPPPVDEAGTQAAFSAPAGSLLEWMSTRALAAPSGAANS